MLFRSDTKNSFNTIKSLKEYCEKLNVNNNKLMHRKILSGTYIEDFNNTLRENKEKKKMKESHIRKQNSLFSKKVKEQKKESISRSEKKASLKIRFNKSKTSNIKLKKNTKFKKSEKTDNVKRSPNKFINLSKSINEAEIKNMLEGLQFSKNTNKTPIKLSRLKITTSRLNNK